MKPQNGFTLVELMVVVAVIGTLTSIALPSYSRYSQRSANAACMAEARAYMTYAVTNAATATPSPLYTPTACESGGVVGGILATGTSVLFTPKLKGDINSLKIVACSSDSSSCVYQ